ncbi:hypothetical protein GCM10023211_09010 [Orbus sasakiae]|uniref:Uncharacterized protein n=2 Tax=Orbus sasakiae TaxID=1078475 RepID=A0ABP9N4I1_9GAMM
MYLYQLMLKKQWLMLEEDDASSSSYYQPKPTRIKHFYDCGYDDIVKQLVNQPQSCKDFYPVLQQVGLPYQSYYDKMPDKVSNTLKTALHQEHVVLVQLPVINGYSGTASYSHDIKPIPIVKKEPTFEPDDSWLVVDLLNHKPELIQILDASNNHQVTTAQTSPNQIFLKHGDVFSPSKVLPKVHIVLGGLGGSYDLALRGDKPLRVKQLAQSWLDELSTLLASGNSPFTIELDEAMASLINQKALPQRGLQAKYIDEHTAFRPDETVGVFFYHMLALLNHTNFITARQRIGTCGADEGEGAIPDVKSLKQALKSLHNIRHSDGQDKPDYAYHNDTLSKMANHYLGSPLVLDGTGGDNDAQSALLTQVKIATEQDQLTDIASLYANAIKLLKHLREPGIIRHVETRREYQLKATKLDYRPVELKKLDFIQLELHANYRYEIVSEDKAYQFIGRFNPDGKVQVKVPAKWASAKSWQLNAQAVEDDFVAKIFPKLVNPTWTLQDRNNAVMGLASGGLIGGVTGYLYGDQIKETVLENLPRITGAAQVASGVMSLYVAGVVGVTGVGAPLAAAIGFVALDNIQAGARSMWTNEHTPTYGGELIEWSGLLPKGYGEITYSLVDIGLVGKAGSLLKAASQTTNFVKFKTVNTVKTGQIVKPTEVTISVEKISLNKPNVIELKGLEVDKIAVKVNKSSSLLDDVSKTAFYAAKNSVKFWVPKDKHMLGTAASRSAQFNTNNVSDIRNLVEEALNSPNAQFLPNNVENSFRVVVDMERKIGTKGQTSIRIIIGDDGKIWNAFPVNFQ